jgi:hypothetical protein
MNRFPAFGTVRKADHGAVRRLPELLEDAGFDISVREIPMPHLALRREAAATEKIRNPEPIH